jgi:hypothetical protein
LSRTSAVGYYREIALKAAAVRKKKRLAREQKRV